MEICARLKSSTYHPIAFTSLKIPGTFTGFPSSCLTISPSKRFFELGFGILLLLPNSLSSNAISVANLVSFVLRLILYAIKKSLHPIIVAPAFGCIILGPKSGLHSGSDNFFANPSYSPLLIFGSLVLFSFCADFSYR